MYSGVGPHVYNGESLYMAPPEPPRSIYGTLPRSTGNMLRGVSESSLPVSSHYATFRRERLGPKVSLKLKQMMMNDKQESQDTMSIMSGATESSGTGPKDRQILSEALYHRPVTSTSDEAGEVVRADTGNEIITEKVAVERVYCCTCLDKIMHANFAKLAFTHRQLVTFQVLGKVKKSFLKSLKILQAFV